MPKLDMRYFFHVVGPSRYQDADGSKFAQVEDAIAHAALIASELAMDGGFAGYSILVVDEAGNEIFGSRSLREMTSVNEARAHCMT